MCVTAGGLDGTIPHWDVEALGLPVLDEGPTRTNLSRPGGRGRPLEREGENNPFVLSEALPVVPAKLVRRIRRGEFVDMAELLKDNMEIERHRAAQGSDGSAHPPEWVGRKEVPDLLSWLHCYSLFAAIMCESHPAKVKDVCKAKGHDGGAAKRSRDETKGKR